MRQLAIKASLVLASGVMLSLLAIVVVGVATYGSGPSSVLRHCPRFEPRPVEFSASGTEGETVPAGPTAALVCRWREGRAEHPERAEAAVRNRALAGLVRVLDSLSPAGNSTGVIAGAEAEPALGFGCESGTPLIYLIGLRYAGESEVQILANYNGCGSISNLEDRTAYGATGFLRSALNRALAGTA